MLDGPRSSRLGIGIALLIALLVAVVIWERLARPAPTEVQTASQASEHVPQEPAGPTAADAPLTPVLAQDSSAPVRAPIVPRVAEAPPSTRPGSIRGLIHAVGPDAPTSIEGFARVDLYSGEEDATTFVAMPVVRIASDHTFEFPSIPYGDWMVSVEVQSCGPAQARVVVSQRQPSPCIDIKVTRAKPQELTVILLDARGEPLAKPFDVAKTRAVGGYTPCFFDRLPPLGAKRPKDALQPTLVQANGDQPGAWVVAKFATGTFGYAAVEQGGYVIDAVPFTSAQSRVTLRVDDARLAAVKAQIVVRVTDAATGAPLPGAMVLLGPAQPTYKGLPSSLRPRSDIDVESTTDDKGVSEFASAPVGSIDVFVARAGSVAEQRTLELHPGRNPECAVALARGFTIRGTLEPGDDGVLSVSASRMEDEDSMRFITKSKCNADGSFEITNLPAGEYAIGRAISVAVGVTRGLAAPIRAGRIPNYVYVDLRNGDVAGVVIRKPPAPTRVITGTLDDTDR